MEVCGIAIGTEITPGLRCDREAGHRGNCSCELYTPDGKYVGTMEALQPNVANIHMAPMGERYVWHNA